MRNLLVSIIALGVLALGVDPSPAKQVAMHNHTSDEIQKACTNAGGEFTQDPGGYGCSTNCHGGHGSQCVVGCKSDHTCTGQVPGRSGPTVSPINVLKGSSRVSR